MLVLPTLFLPNRTLNREASKQLPRQTCDRPVQSGVDASFHRRRPAGLSSAAPLILRPVGRGRAGEDCAWARGKAPGPRPLECRLSGRGDRRLRRGVAPVVRRRSRATASRTTAAKRSYSARWTCRRRPVPASVAGAVNIRSRGQVDLTQPTPGSARPPTGEAGQRTVLPSGAVCDPALPTGSNTASGSPRRSRPVGVVDELLGRMEHEATLERRRASFCCECAVGSVASPLCAAAQPPSPRLGTDSPPRARPQAPDQCRCGSQGAAVPYETRVPRTRRACGRRFIGEAERSVRQSSPGEA